MFQSYDLPRAAKALRKLVSNPDDLPQVFTLIDSLQGSAPERFYAGFQRSEEGRELLKTEPDIVKFLANREWLKSSAVFRKLPELRKLVADLERRIEQLEAGRR